MEALHQSTAKIKMYAGAPSKPSRMSSFLSGHQAQRLKLAERSFTISITVTNKMLAFT
jgi:hypothetical protein